MYKLALYFNLFLITTIGYAQDIAILHYSGGGDWYSNPTAIPNLIEFCNENIQTKINTPAKVVKPGDIDLFQYPFIHMTGHGNVYFSDEDAANIRLYLQSGGFIHIDDNYGMKPYVKKELLKIFPSHTLEELALDHPIFTSAYQFPKGLPKIHEHDGKRPQALGIFYEDRLVLLFTYESDLGDGWENPEIHNDSPEIRRKALQMGANIIKYAFEH